MQTEITLKISGDVSELKGVREAIKAFLAKIKTEEHNALANVELNALEESRLVLAVDEALANIIEHGYENKTALAEAQISLTMRQNGSDAEFELCDNGVPFNPLEHKTNTEFYYEEGLEDGLGLIALTILDTAYERKADQNILRIKCALRKEIGKKI
ncbi:MAG TPA: ATP-binding protein [Turneriella sp.]|nr:ATP-binding protein [Turneriella sp.]